MRAALLALAACRIGFDPNAGGDGGTNDDGDSPPVTSTISAGIDHTCLIRNTQLYCFGANTEGQLGVGDLTQRLVPALVPGAWRDVAAGGGHTCAIDTAGALYCWGGNASGELGVGDFAIRKAPARVALPSPVRMVDATASHTCAVLDDGRLLAWGENSEGQLGQNDSPNAADVPAPVAMSEMTGWTSTACGYAHTLGIVGGAISGTGRNTQHQLGLGDGASMQYRVLQAIDPGPWSVITGGQNHSCGIKTGTLYCWGDNSAMELGTGDATAHSVATPIGPSGPWLDIDADTFGGCALSGEGEAYCWGRNVEGQLGLDDQMDRYVPTRTGALWKSMSVGRFHACGEDRDGTFWCAGKGSSGQLGIGPAGNTPSWTQVMLPAN